MNDSSFEREANAFLAFNQLLATAREVKAKFDEAGLELPPPLARMMGESSHAGGRQRFRVPPLPSPQRPEIAQHDWVWFSAKDASTTTLALAVLAYRNVPMTPREVIEDVKKLDVTFNLDSIYNVFPRLEAAQVITPIDGKWGLVDPSQGPILHKGNVWADPAVLPKADLAAHRRNVIVHILNASPGGLMVMQIVWQLKESGMCKAPVSKDLLKADMKMLGDANKVKRISNSNKWTTKNAS